MPRAACLAEKQHTSFIVFVKTRPVLESTIFHTRYEGANYYITDAAKIN